MLNRGTDAGMDSQRQPEAGRFDRIKQAVKFGRLIADDVKDRAEDLALEVSWTIEFKNMWCNVRPGLRRGWRYRTREANDRRAARRCDMRVKPCGGGAINDWTNIGLQIA